MADHGRSRVGGAVGLVIAVVVLAAATAAHAVVPGTNGKVFYEIGGTSDIYSVNPDGSNPTDITNTPSLSEQRPSVSGDGQHIAFMAYAPAPNPGWSIYKMNANGTGETQLTTDGSSVTNFEPGFSPDGTKIVFMKQDSTAQDLWMVGVNGGTETNLTNTLSTIDAHSDECCAEYSPDGTKIVYVNAYDTASADDVESADIWVMNSNGSNQQALTGPDYPVQDTGPSWSPDGTKIVFSRDPTGGSAPATLYVMNANGTGVAPVMNGGVQIPGYAPTWSPDGTKIAYTDSGGDISVVPAGGGTPTPITHGGNDNYSTWAVAGDTTPPDTTITFGPPPFTKKTSANFSFVSSEAGSTFKCRFDGAATFTACASPKSYTGLAEGSHTFRVKAIDSAGNHDPTAATRTFTVDTTPPNTTITSGPSGTIHVRHASFAFTSSESSSHFQCRFDAAATFTNCVSPKSYSGLANGSHAFRVRAIDQAGNIDATPAVRNFNVQP